jgi:phosphate transport system permease protein
MTSLMALAVIVVGVVLVLVLATVAVKGWAIVSGSFPKWFTKDIQLAPRRPGPGMKAAIIGTCIITFTATLIAVPLGIAGAIYLNEYGRDRPFARVLRFLANVMAGVPSVVMGLFIFVFWVVPRGVDGLNGFSGALALACLMLPIVVRSSEEMLRLVPQNLRDASYALGGSTSRTTLRVVLPKAAPGVISGCLLAVARAAGETAPLIFTIGAAKSTNWNVFGGTNTALSMQIYGNAKESFVTAQQRAWGAALTLIALAFAFTVIARVLSARLARTR